MTENNPREGAGSDSNLQGYIDEYRSRLASAAPPPPQSPLNAPQAQEETLEGAEEGQAVEAGENAIFSRMNQIAREAGPGAPPPGPEAPQYAPPGPAPGEHTLTEHEKLCRLGYGAATFKFGGNDISIKTLTQNEELTVLERMAQYPPAVRMRAQQVFTVALAITHVNKKPWITRLLLTETDSHDEDRFQKVREFYPTHIDYFFNKFVELRQEVDEKALYAGKE